jgi:hypothetical protein
VTVLLVVGVGVVVLGALVLLLWPDRPGGKIAWQGLEVSSIGAGLPLIVVGIVAIGVAGAGVVGGDGGGDGGSGESGKDQTTAALKCPDDLAKSVPSTRVATVESGANAQIIAGQTVSKTEPFGLRFTDGGETVGAMSATFFPGSQVFKARLVDAECHSADVGDLTPGEGALAAIPNYRDVQVDLEGHSYLLNLGGGSDIRVNFARFVP